MENFPTEIIENILFRLPIEVALQARRVCTAWKAHLRNYKSGKTGGFLFAIYLSAKPGGDSLRQELFYEDEYDHYDHANINHYYTNKTLSKIEHGRYITKSSPSKDIVVGSCNGLACFGKYITDVEGVDPFLICNPLTGESILLPEFNYLELHRDVSSTLITNGRLAASGFGYCPLTSKYKVATIYYCQEEQQGYVHVYTVGGGWRFVGFINLYTFEHSTGIYANGALYWLHQSDRELEEYEILAFDLESEKFHSILLPLSEDFVYENGLLVSRRKLLGGNNNLYLAYTNCTFSHTDTEIWVYKRNNINAEGTSSSCWIKEFSIQHKGNDIYTWPFAITKTNEVLFWYNHNIPPRIRLYRYDPKTSTIKNLWDENAKGMDFIENIDAIPHTQSLVSLKDLGKTGVTYLKDLEKHLSQKDFGKNDVMGYKYTPISSTEDDEG